MKKEKVIPKISVIIPVYNSEKYLSHCLDTVVNQSLKEIEIICVNDGSTDHSYKILQKQYSIDNRIRIINQSHSNAGVARNKGLENAKGEYLLFLDSDDFFENDMLETIYKAAKKSEADIVVFAAKTYDVMTGKINILQESLRICNCPVTNPFEPKEIKNHLFNSFQNWAWNKLFKHDFVKKNKIYFQDVDRTNDMLFTCVALFLAKKIYVINKPLIYYRIGQLNNLQSTNHLAPDSFMVAFLETHKQLNRISQRKYIDYKQSFLNCVLDGLKYNYEKIQKNIDAVDYIKHSIIYHGKYTFGFLEFKDSYYYNEESIKWYKSLSKANKPKIAYYLNQVKNVYNCYKENGIKYTINRILYHLHLIKDNEIYIKNKEN